jgi:hypothetical protein
VYDEEFRSHFGFAAHLIFEVLDVLQLPATPAAGMAFSVVQNYRFLGSWTRFDEDAPRRPSDKDIPNKIAR